jgi:CspA family cold shock protein
MIKGTVKTFNFEKGYGFIRPDGGAADVFAHISQIKTEDGSIAEGDKVQFDVGPGRNGKEAALNVQHISGNR